MKSRNIKPAFFTNEELAELPFEYRLLFIGLWCLADREGRLEDRPKKIRNEIFPGQGVDCDAGLTALHNAELISRYEVDGGKFIIIHKFTNHQRPHVREARSSISPPTKGDPRTSLGVAKDEPRTDLGISKDEPRTSQGVLNVECGMMNDECGMMNVESPASPSPVNQNLIGGSLSAPPPKPRKARKVKPAPDVVIEAGPPTPLPAPNGPVVPPDKVPRTKAVWDAFCEAYRQRYGVEPTRNATTNAQMGMFVNRVPLEEAPEIATWYVFSQKRTYIERGHAVAMLLRDAESLRMEWQRGRGVTQAEAIQADRTAGRGNVFRGILEENDGLEAPH